MEQIDADQADVYEAIKGYEVNNECIEKETIWVWCGLLDREAS